MCFVRYVIPWLCLAAVAACTPYVGGPCDYDTVRGTATIHSGTDGASVASFEPDEGQPHSDLLRPDMRFEVEQPVTVGARYPAEVDVITRGTCTPLWFRLLQGEARRDIQPDGGDFP